MYTLLIEFKNRQSAKIQSEFYGFCFTGYAKAVQAIQERQRANEIGDTNYFNHNDEILTRASLINKEGKTFCTFGSA